MHAPPHPMLLFVRVLVMGTEMEWLIAVTSVLLIFNATAYLETLLEVSLLELGNFIRGLIDTICRVGVVCASRHQQEVSPGWGCCACIETPQTQRPVPHSPREGASFPAPLLLEQTRL